MKVVDGLPAAPARSGALRHPAAAGIAQPDQAQAAGGQRRADQGTDA